MKLISSSLFVFYQKNWVAILSIVGLTFLIWHKILGQMFLGEGYYYFDRVHTFNNTSGIQDNSTIAILGQYDNFARLMFDIFPPFFRDNIQAYLLLELSIFIVLFITLYTVTSNITKSKFLGFSATVFFLSNYVALFEYVAAGNYQRFAQRIPNFIPAILSFYYLYKFYEYGKIKFYLISLFLYGLAILMGYFTGLILPLFVIYPFVQLINNKKTIKELTVRVLTALSFAIITILLTKASNHSPPQTFIQFLSSESNLLERTLYQIPMITTPLDLMVYIARHLEPPLGDPFMPIVRIFFYPSFALYIIGAVIVYKRARHLIVLYLTSTLSMISSMFLYIYIDPRLNVLKYFGEDRYYLISSLFATLAWAIILRAVFMKNEMWYKTISTIVLAAFVIYNSHTIWKHVDSIQYKSEMLKRYIVYVEALSPLLNEESIIVVPSYLSWPTPIITQFIIQPSIQIISEHDGWEEKFWTNKDNVFVIDYDYERQRGKGFETERGSVVDLTEKYRRGERINFLN